MKESNLAKAIDQAAEQRADKIIKAIRDSITKALEQHWRPKLAGEEFIGDDIRALLGKLSPYVDRARGVVVQVWENDTPGCNGTPWEGTYRVAIKHTRANNPSQHGKRGFAKPVTWDDMQAIKDHFWPERIAIEIYPPHDKIVDVADMRWMWVLPKGAVLPFNLQGSCPERLES